MSDSQVPLRARLRCCDDDVARRPSMSLIRFGVMRREIARTARRASCGPGVSHQHRLRIAGEPSHTSRLSLPSMPSASDLVWIQHDLERPPARSRAVACRR